MAIDPAAPRGPISAPATWIHPPAGIESSDAAKVALVARGPAASRSKKVNQIEALGSAPGRLWTVCRIQIPRPPPGRQAFR